LLVDAYPEKAPQALRRKPKFGQSGAMNRRLLFGGKGMNEFFPLVEAARRLDVPVRWLTDAFYKRILDDRHCVWVGHRRAIPSSKLDEIGRILETRRRRERVAAGE